MIKCGWTMCKHCIDQRGGQGHCDHPNGEESLKEEGKVKLLEDTMVQCTMYSGVKDEACFGITHSCGECKELFPREELQWVKDRYNIPFKLCCPNCFDVVQEEIEKWEFDPSYAGERLEEDY